jgi:ubiquinone/menaquinone biosynthesis C-methylase UbiE
MNQNKIKESFGKQASQFSKNHILSNEEQLNFIVNMGCIQEEEWVLDMGCGTGLLTRAIEQKTKRVVGLDLTHQMLEEAKLQSRKQGKSILFLQGDGHQLPFLDGQFDCIMTRLTVHHFPQPLKILKELVRVLKPNGRLIISDIVANMDPQKQKKHNEVEQLRDPSHVKFLNETELQELIKKAGLEIQETKKWETERRIDEWMGIIGEIESEQQIIESFEENLEDDQLGIQVFRDNNGIGFIHQWMVIRAINKE